MNRHARAVTALPLLLLLVLPALGAGPLPNQRITYRGTVRAFDARSGNLDLVAGVGMALRVVRIRTSAATPGRMGRGQPAGVTPRRGDILRVDCRPIGGALFADRIARVEAR